MNRAKPTEPSALALADDAVRLVRNAPADALFCYFLGSVPFCLALLYFWAAMSDLHGGGKNHLPAAALALTLLYIWMKGWQSVYALRLREGLLQAAPARWTFARIAGLFALQGAIQPSALFVLPLAALTTVPFGWVHAFYENVTVLGDGRDRLSRLVRAAWEEALLWPRQNHLLIWFLSPFVLTMGIGLVLGCVYFGSLIWPYAQIGEAKVFLLGAILLLLALPLSPLGTIVWINLGAALFLLPQLLHMLLGVETVFTVGGIHVFNTTFLLIVSVLSFLVLDPFLKAAYVLRCFEGRSRRSGEDLLAALRTGQRGNAPALLLLLGWAFLALPLSAHAQDQETATSPPSAEAAPVPKPPATLPPSIDPDTLQQSIGRTLQLPEFSWRESAGEPDLQDAGWGRFLIPFLKEAAHWCQKHLHFLKAWFEWCLELLKHWFHPHPQPETSPDQNSDLRFVRNIVVVLAGTCGLLLFWLLAIYRKNRRSRAAAAPLAATVSPAPDLRDESVLPTDLPVDAWARLALELQEKGELRLALRALYFSMLSALAERNVIRIGKSKSNREYLGEVDRRGGRESGMSALFRENIALFEKSWYGLHRVDPEGISHFRRNQEGLLERL